MMEYLFAPPTDEWSFEVFCLRLLKVHWPGSEPQRFGTRGQSQEGIDIIDMGGVEPLRAAQCKHKELGKLLTRSDIYRDVENAMRFEPPIGKYYILTTSKRSIDLQKAILELNQGHQRNGLFNIILLTWDKIEEILKENPGLWDKIIDPPSKRAIVPLEKKMDVFGQRMEILIAQNVEDKYDSKLESARKRLEEHARQEATIILRQLQTGHWSDLSESQRFLTLTYLAQIEYADDHWLEAGQLFIKAKDHRPDEERAQINEALGYELLANLRRLTPWLESYLLLFQSQFDRGR